MMHFNINNLIPRFLLFAFLAIVMSACIPQKKYQALQTENDDLRQTNREGITIPFPIRTLDFGIKGGKPLSSMLSTNGSKSLSETVHAN